MSNIPKNDVFCHLGFRLMMVAILCIVAELISQRGCQQCVAGHL